MAIGNAANKAKKSTQVQKKRVLTSKTTPPSPLKGHEDRSATLRIYVKDREMLKEAKIAALEDDTSLSQLWEDWTVAWLKSRK